MPKGWQVSQIVLVSASLDASCATGPRVVAPEAATGSREPGDAPVPRHPDGVFFDLPSALPPTRSEAHAEGIVLLREPISRDEALLAVRGYFRAFLSGESATLAGVLLHDARRLDEPPGELLPALTSRLKGVDYSRVSADAVAAYDETRVMTYGDLRPGHLPAAREGDLRPRPEPMREGDVLCVVPVRSPRVAGVRLFGNEVALLLRRSTADGALKVAGLSEEGAPWP